MANRVRITRWSVVDRQPGDFLRLPERAVLCLAGAVYGHPKFPDGTLLNSSPLVGRDGECVVTESGNVYELGEVSPAYESACPGARARLLASLPQVAAGQGVGRG